MLNQVETGGTTVREAAEVLTLSLRHVRRLLAAYRNEGAQALAHGNRGRKPGNALDEGLKERVVELARSTYAGGNNQHFTIAGATNSKEANRVLWAFLPRFNKRFAVPSREPGSAYRQIPDRLDLDDVFCFKYQRTMGRDNVVRFGEHRLQIVPTNGRSSYVKAKVGVQERMDGSLAVYYQGQCLLTRPAPPEAPVLRVRNTTRFIPGARSQEVALPVTGKDPGAKDSSSLQASSESSMAKRF